MEKGASTTIVMILVMLITVSLILMSYQWLLKYSPQTQWELEKSSVKKEGCLKIENIDTLNKKMTIRNCGKIDLSNFIVYLDSEPFTNYSGTLASGEIVQISYTKYIYPGDHDVQVSSDYAEAPKIIFYKPPCDIYIYQYMIPYTIDQSNTYYCLAENVHIDGQNAINSSAQNSTLNCQNYNIDGNDAVYTNGVYLSGNNNTVRNCNITDFYQGIYILNSNSNILINNTASSNEYGIELEFANYNTLLNNIDLDVTYLWNSGYNTLTNNKMTSYIRLFGTLCVNNNITGGSIASFSPYDYELDSAGAFNYFRNTNFTGSRKIHSLNSWFNYNNDTTGELWLKTNVSFIGTCVVPCMIITRKLINWNNTLLQWNDSYDVVGMARYNVTGLKPNKWYLVYNNSDIVYALKTDSLGNLPSFTIYLPSGKQHEIKVEAISGFCDVPIISFSDTYVIDQNNTYYCLFENFNINNKNAINFSSGVQNTTLDCLSHNIVGDHTWDFSGVYLTGSNTKNNTIKNCNINDFSNGIRLNNGTNNTIINNKLTSNMNDGVRIEYNSESNTVTDNLCDFNSLGIRIDSSINNIVKNNTVTSNDCRGISLEFRASYNIVKNNTVTSNGFVSQCGGIEMWVLGSNNTITNNTVTSNYMGIVIQDSSDNNSIIGGSVSGNTYDYSILRAGKTNNFTYTNFTAARKISFYNSSDIFNYNNQTTGNIWLKTNISSEATITRKLLNWITTLIRWNDTFSNTSGSIVARYNVTGLLTNTNYNVYNNTVLAYTINSSSNGQISFTINLPASQEREIRVEKFCQVFINFLPYNITQNNTYYCLNTSSTNLAKTAIQFGNSSFWTIQNSTLDCRGYNLDGGLWDETYGVYLTGSNTKNNTIKNCNVTNFIYGIFLNGSHNNTISNNTVNDNVDGIQVGKSPSFSCNNTIINNTISNNMEYAIYLRQGSVSNVITDNTARNNVWGGIFINSHSNTAINNVLINGQHRGLYMVNCHNNTITGGSIYNNTDSDYEVSIEATDNNVTNTNFTDSRKIHFWDTTSWFDYRNDTSQNIWIKTNISSEATITRKLINWSNALMQWNDTFSNTSGSIIARYNVTGLSTSVNYNVYNNSALTYTINSGTNGEISFTIYLPANQERNITVQKV